MITADNVTDELIVALRAEARAVVAECKKPNEDAGDMLERVRACNAALGLRLSDGALGVLDQRACRERVAAILENARQCSTLHHYGADPVEYPEDDEGCEGHPAGPFDPMGQTVYCDGTCRGDA